LKQKAFPTFLLFRLSTNYRYSRTATSIVRQQTDHDKTFHQEEAIHQEEARKTSPQDLKHSLPCGAQQIPSKRKQEKNQASARPHKEDDRKV
jgi:hypothetical protein